MVYGFKGTGEIMGNPFFEITSAYPEIVKFYGLLSGPAFCISFSLCGIAWGILA
jgi:hypothetical protein